jgi:hypothetical protein
MTGTLYDVALLHSCRPTNISSKSTRVQITRKQGK